MQAISRIVAKGLDAYARLPLSARASALPYLLASLPLLVSSTLGAIMLTPIITAATTLFMYDLSKTIDPLLFELPKQKARLLVTIPLTTFIMLWGVLLAYMGRRYMLTGIVGPFCLVLLVACAPAYRWKESRTWRLIPPKFTFAIAGALSFAAAITFTFFV